jgi:hypothetical protein
MTVENGSAWVIWVGDDSINGIDGADMTLAEQVLSAIDRAKEAGRETPA